MKDIVIRYFHEKVRKSWSDNPERLWRKKGLETVSGFLQLSTFALTESDLQVRLMAISVSNLRKE